MESKKNNYILGLNCTYHDSAVCLIKNGKVIAFIEEERLNRKKHAKPAKVNNSDELPTKSINYCLNQANITLKDIKHIGYSLNPKKRFLENTKHKHPYKIQKGEFGTIEGEKIFSQKNYNVEKKLRKQGFQGEFHYLNHHDCHAAGAYFSSGKKSAAILVVDGIGEFESTSWYTGKGNKIKKIGQINFPNSLGFLWEKFSKLLGFSEYHAAKVMGLSSYGNSKKYKNKFEKIVKTNKNGTFELNDSIIQFRTENYKELEKIIGIKRNKKPILNVNDSNQHYADIAAALQEVTEEVLLNLIKHIKTKTKLDSLCISGGVALNCVANAKIIYENIFKDIYIQPQANDAGTAIGAAFYVSTHILNEKNVNPLPHAYLGPKFNEDSILNTLKGSNLEYKKVSNIEKETAKLLTKGNLIAWFQGNMEAGPRALGHRTILADPRNKNCLEVINKKVKLREPFRPLCPSFLEEEVEKWIEFGKQKKIPDPAQYMLVAFNAKKGKKKLIPAVIHVDNTSRIQVVNKKTSPKYWKMINEFFKLTKVPVVMNTSFNIQEPIICSPKEAIQTFKKSKIDYLVIGNYLCKKKPTILIKNADYIVTQNKERAILKNSSILIEGNKIIECPSNKLKADKIINAKGKIVFPGFINTHHHFFQTAFRFVPEMQNAPLDKWVALLGKYLEKVNLKDWYNCAMTSMAELILSGCTTSADHCYIFPNNKNKVIDKEIEAAQKIGMRFHPVRGSMTLSKEQGTIFPKNICQSLSTVLSEIQRVINKYHDPSTNSMCRIAAGPCFPFFPISSSEKELKATIKLCRKNHIRFHTHIAEEFIEFKTCLKKYGKTPVELLAKAKCLGEDVWLAHCNFLTTKDIALLQKSKTSIASCPSANARGAGISKVTEYLKAKIPVGIGVDGAAGNDTSNILSELRMLRTLQGAREGVLASYLINYNKKIQKQFNEDFKGISYLEISKLIDIATLHGAKALGRENEIGSIENGKLADIAIFDDKSISHAGAVNRIGSIFSCTPLRAEYILINGKIIVKKGILQTEDENKIIKNQIQTTKKLMDR